jgi:geranylgeranyl pyrophosphate synthase
VSSSAQNSGAKLVGDGYAVIEALDPGSLAHDDVIAMDASDADNLSAE